MYPERGPRKPLTTISAQPGCLPRKTHRFLMDTLAIRIHRKSFNIITNSTSNRHNSGPRRIANSRAFHKMEAHAYHSVEVPGSSPFGSSSSRQNAKLNRSQLVENNRSGSRQIETRTGCIEPDCVVRILGLSASRITHQQS